MSYLELAFEIEQKQADEYCAKLESLGAAAVSFFDAEDKPLLEPLPGSTPLWPRVKMVGLFDKEISIPVLKKAMQTSFPTLRFNLTPLEDKEWSRTWLDHFKPMQFGQRLWVAPLDHTICEKNAAVVKLDPGLAFGTGTHPTTALCLEWLDNHPPLHQSVIDYGCGSGILGIAALLLGAKKVYAIDYDPQALWSTRENAQRNHLTAEELVILHPDSLCDPFPNQTVLANILAEPLIHLAPRLREFCELGAMLVLSGLLTSQVDAVKTAYETWFQFDLPRTKDDWVLLAAKRIA